MPTQPERNRCLDDAIAAIASCYNDSGDQMDDGLLMAMHAVRQLKRPVENVFDDHSLIQFRRVSDFWVYTGGEVEAVSRFSGIAMHQTTDGPAVSIPFHEFKDYRKKLEHYAYRIVT